MKNIALTILIACTTISLSGCIAAAAGAGIAGGAYIERHYDVDLNVKKKQNSPAKSKKEAPVTDSDPAQVSTNSVSKATST